VTGCGQPDDAKGVAYIMPDGMRRAAVVVTIAATVVVTIAGLSVWLRR
jgi:hypothetical protein